LGPLPDEHERAAVSNLRGLAFHLEGGAGSPADEARDALNSARIELLVLDLKLEEGSGHDLLDELRGIEELRTLPIVIHTGTDLSEDEERHLRRQADSVVVKTAGSPARLLDETLLHLHRPVAALPETGRQLLEELYKADDALHGKRILVVDDDTRNAFSLSRALLAQGMHVETAENGVQALERVRNTELRYDLVLMDIMMPEMDGHEATRRIRTLPDHEDLPIIILTAKAMREDRLKSLAAGASDFVTKPVDVEQLLSLLRVWLYR
jgi:CheY-like chemotaxis protein